MTISSKPKTSWSKLSHWLYRWISPVCDPVRFFRGLSGFTWFLGDWVSYSRLPSAEAIRLVDTWPQVHDLINTSVIDVHYFYANGWAMRRIVAQQPRRHVDIGSQTILANLLAAVIPVLFVDYRPLRAKLAGVESLGADILALPFGDGAIESLSCLHVAEHIGLGRYGDPLDPQGTRKAAQDLTRVLAKGGNLFFALPVGKSRLCFNAHRIHAPETIRGYFSELDLVEFSGVDDNGRFVEHATLGRFQASEYACGMYWFRKPE